MNPDATFIRPRLPRLLTVQPASAFTFALAATLLNAALSSSSADLLIHFLAYAGVYIAADMAVALIGWRKHFYSLLIADGKLQTRSFLGVPRHAVPITGLSLVPLERLSLGQRLGASLKLTGLDGSSLRFCPVFFSQPQLRKLRLALQAHGAA